MSAYYGAPMVDETRLCSGKGYLTDELTAAAIGFLDGEAGRAEPFWLSLNYTAPHYPWIDSHPEEYTRLYDGCAFDSIPAEPPHPWNAGGNPATDEGHGNRRDSLVGYFAATTAMDAGIGRVMAHLDRLGLRKSTLVVFMSDNGMNCGHHGIWGKGNGTRPQNMYDTSVKVPCIFSQPGRVPEGEVAYGLFSAYDFWPTILDHAGLERPAGGPEKPGRSFARLLAGEAQTSADAVVVFDEYGPVRMIRTRDWKYVHRFPDGPHELFDLRADPGERENRIGDPAVADELARLRARLTDWFGRYTDADADGAVWAATGAGQLARARPGVPREVAFATVPIAALKKTKQADQPREEEK
jgi:arylsulfatase A-like enzyme